jgi:allantoin racemase
MRIRWIHPTRPVEALAPLWRRMEDAQRAIARPDSTVAFAYPELSANFGRSFYAEQLNAIGMVEAAVAAEAEGCDAAVIGCWNDPLWEAREVVSIPVASVGEQSMLTALTLGYRFAVVTVSDKVAASIERDLVAYGLGARAISRPVRAIEPESDARLLLSAVEDPRAQFVPRFEAAARDCIADGAEVILTGCGYYGPLLRLAGYTEVPGTGVPVVDCSAVALKQAEAMADLAAASGFAKSRACYFRAPPREPLDTVREAVGIARRAARAG